MNSDDSFVDDDLALAVARDRCRLGRLCHWSRNPWPEIPWISKRQGLAMADVIASDDLAVWHVFFTSLGCRSQLTSTVASELKSSEVQNFHSLVMIVMKLVCSALSWSKFGCWYDHGYPWILTAAGHTTFRYRGPTDESFQNSCTDPYSQVLTIHPKFDLSVMQTVCTSGSLGVKGQLAAQHAGSANA